jgi:hypothetical protein
MPNFKLGPFFFFFSILNQISIYDFYYILIFLALLDAKLLIKLL